LQQSYSRREHLNTGQLNCRQPVNLIVVQYRKLCKQKLIEISERAEQLGGNEARIGLVCCRDDPSLQSELEGSKRNFRVKVFGRADLKDLGRKIQAWVEMSDS
jgi:hypothetical protein